MRTEGKIDYKLRDNTKWLEPAHNDLNGGHSICLCYGPDAADNAEFIRTAWNEWEEIRWALHKMFDPIDPPEMASMLSYTLESNEYNRIANLLKRI